MPRLTIPTTRPPRTCLRATSLAALAAVAAACGNDTAGETVPARPTYVEHIAPILERACTGCHAAPTSSAEPRNCVRVDRWDSAPDSLALCTDSATAGMIFGVRDGGPMIVENIVSGRMPLGGTPLPADELEVFQRWREVGYPKRAQNQPPTIQLTAPPPAGVTVCEPDCRYAVQYTIDDPDQDSVRWTLGWSGGGKTGTFGAGDTGALGAAATSTSGMLTIDATTLASGTYTLTATLDDGTAIVETPAGGTITVPAGHNAAPTVTVTSPNGGEVYYDTQTVTIRWTGSDPDHATLSYDVSAVGASTIAIKTLSAPVGPAQLDWTPPKASSLTSYRIEVTARDGGSPALTATDRSDADFAIAPPPRAVSFANEIQPIFTASCTSTACHDALQSAAGLVLTPGNAYQALVDVFSTESPCTGYKLVAPGQPDQSFLIFKLAGTGACTSGSRMPKGMPALSTAQLQLFRDWIANGAPNN